MPQWHSGPDGSTTLCPISPACPSCPRSGAPLTMMPAPTPIRPIRNTTSSQPRAAPRSVLGEHGEVGVVADHDRDVGVAAARRASRRTRRRASRGWGRARPCRDAGRPCRARSPRCTTGGAGQARRARTVVGTISRIWSTTSSGVGGWAESAWTTSRASSAPPRPTAAVVTCGDVDVDRDDERSARVRADHVRRSARASLPPRGTDSWTSPSSTRSATSAPIVERLSPSRCGQLGPGERSVAMDLGRAPAPGCAGASSSGRATGVGMAGRETVCGSGEAAGAGPSPGQRVDGRGQQQHAHR